MNFLHQWTNPENLACIKCKQIHDKTIYLMEVDESIILCDLCKSMLDACVDKVIKEFLSSSTQHSQCYITNDLAIPRLLKKD